MSGVRQEYNPELNTFYGRNASTFLGLSYRTIQRHEKIGLVSRIGGPGSAPWFSRKVLLKYAVDTHIQIPTESWATLTPSQQRLIRFTGQPRGV